MIELGISQEAPFISQRATWRHQGWYSQQVMDLSGWQSRTERPMGDGCCWPGLTPPGLKWLMLDWLPDPGCMGVQISATKTARGGHEIG